MLIDFNDWDSELFGIARAVERYASRLNLEVIYNEGKFQDFVASRHAASFTDDEDLGCASFA